MRCNRTPLIPTNRLLAAAVIGGLALILSPMAGGDPAAAQAVPLQNPGFETGDLSGWQSWGELSGVQRSEEWFGSIPAHSGTYFLGSAASGGVKNGGVYRQVSVAPYAPHDVSVWYYIYWIGGSYDSRECWLGWDPNGGTDPDSGDIVWAGPGTDADPYGEAGWQQLRLQGVLAGPTGTATIFLKHVQMSAEAWNINCFDDASLQQTGEGHGLQAAFEQGWNMISLPLAPADPNPQVVLADCIAAGNTLQNNLYRYDPATGYQVYPLQFSTLEVNRAYWLYLEHACSNEFYGSLIPTQSATLQQGWNFIGFPYFEPVSLLDVSVCDGGVCYGLQDAIDLGWLDSVFYYFPAGYEGAGLAPWNSDQSLRPANGYWVHATVGGLSIELRRLCSDGTPYGSCSATKPLYCSDGELVDNCHVCGCGSGSVCLAGPSCVTPTVPPGKSKLSIHTGFGGPYSMSFVANGRPTVVKILDSFQYADDVKAASPATKVVGRIYLPEQPMDGDPVARAQEWWNTCKSKILQYPDVDYWEGYNEPPGLVTAQAMAWYATFEQTRVSILAQNDRKACIGCFGTGGIPLPENDPSVWTAFLPAIDAAMQHGGVLSMHEYGCPMGCTFDPASGEGLLCGRYRKIYRDLLIPQDKVIPLVITESGVDAVGNVSGCCNCWGWRTCYTWQEYRDQLIWYDSILRQDDYVIGMTIFALEIYGWDTFDIGDPDLMAWLTSYVAGGG